MVGKVETYRIKKYDGREKAWMHECEIAELCSTERMSYANEWCWHF